MIEQALLRKLKELQSEYALESLQRPNTRDAFEYGHRVGVIGGLDMAVGLLLTLLDEERNGNPDL